VIKRSLATCTRRVFEQLNGATRSLTANSNTINKVDVSTGNAEVKNSTYPAVLNVTLSVLSGRSSLAYTERHHGGVPESWIGTKHREKRSRTTLSIMLSSPTCLPKYMSMKLVSFSIVKTLVHHSAGGRVSR